MNEQVIQYVIDYCLKVLEESTENEDERANWTNLGRQQVAKHILEVMA